MTPSSRKYGKDRWGNQIWIALRVLRDPKGHAISVGEHFRRAHLPGQNLGRTEPWCSTCRPISLEAAS